MVIYVVLVGVDGGLLLLGFVGAFMFLGGDYLLPCFGGFFLFFVYFPVFVYC